MENFIEKFFKIADDFKKKPYDLLDFTKNLFDRDFLEFNVNVTELETALSLQGFMNASFENFMSSEHALELLRQFKVVLQRETLKVDLDFKYTVICHNYGLGLETVRKVNDKQKVSPRTFNRVARALIKFETLWHHAWCRSVEPAKSWLQATQSLIIRHPKTGQLYAPTTFPHCIIVKLWPGTSTSTTKFCS